MKKIHLLIIDPQNDFCDPQNGNLYVPGAEQDMLRLATMVDRLRDKLADIHVTLDSHHMVDIAHPVFWRNSNGENTAPFSQITAADVLAGTWTTTLPSARPRALCHERHDLVHGPASDSRRHQGGHQRQVPKHRNRRGARWRWAALLRTQNCWMRKERATRKTHTRTQLYKYSHTPGHIPITTITTALMLTYSL